MSLRRFLAHTDTDDQRKHAAVRAKFQGEFLDSSVVLSVNRLAWLRSWAPGLITLNGVTSQPVFFR